jgi:hypothetical protein
MERVADLCPRDGRAADGWRDSRRPCELHAYAGYINAANSETSSLYISTEMDHAYRITKAARNSHQRAVSQRRSA